MHGAFSVMSVTVKDLLAIIHGVFVRFEPNLRYSLSNVTNKQN